MAGRVRVVDHGCMTRSVHVGVLVLAAVLLSGCGADGGAGAVVGGPATSPGATTGPSDPADPSTSPVPAPAAFAPPPADGPVAGQGTVLQIGDAPPQLCLGGVAESYPPQCSGPEVAGWDWGLAQQAETASGVTWGAYAVTGTWDGSVFTRTGIPVPLSLYDALPFEDPLAGRQGTTDQQELDRILTEVYAGHEGYAVTAGVDRGFVSLMVVYDDGSFQARMDAEYGSDVVVVQSALRPTA